jgi:predicted transcriptional regulator
MSKQLSTYERKMQDKKFKAAYDKHYKELLFSELLISLMEEDEQSVRSLAQRAKISPSVIQGLRSGMQQDMKVSNLIRIVEILGYKVVLQKEEQMFILFDEIRENQHHLSVRSAS